MIVHEYVRTASFTWARVDQNRGFERIYSEPVAVAVRFRQDDGNLTPPGYVEGSQFAQEIVDDWLTQYLADRDQLHAVSIVPTRSNIAKYLLGVFRAASANVREVVVSTERELHIARWEPEP